MPAGEVAGMANRGLKDRLRTALRTEDERSREQPLDAQPESMHIVYEDHLVEEQPRAFYVPRKDPKRHSKENEMALEGHLTGLKEIRGYKAAGIMEFTGDMLASDSADPNIDLSLVGATFNDIFRAAHGASKSIDLDACREMVISTPKGLIVMRCSGTDAPVHFHMISVLAADGNQALMKMQLEKAMPAIMAELN
jgi:predicted regulator of Ras-like GTPase activity (Roadblock/LC7/MglB family)